MTQVGTPSKEQNLLVTITSLSGLASLFDKESKPQFSIECYRLMMHTLMIYCFDFQITEDEAHARLSKFLRENPETMVDISGVDTSKTN